MDKYVHIEFAKNTLHVQQNGDMTYVRMSEVIHERLNVIQLCTSADITRQN